MIKPKLPKWENVRPILEQKFYEAGIAYCELKYEGCAGNTLFTVGFAHSRKSKYWKNSEHVSEVIKADTNCHRKLENLGKIKMEQEVRRIISERRNPVN